MIEQKSKQKVSTGDEANSLVVEPLRNLAGVLLLGVDFDFGHLDIGGLFYFDVYTTKGKARG